MEYVGFTEEPITEDDFILAQRYQTIIGALSIDETELDGKLPDEVKTIIDQRLNAEKFKRTETELYNDTVKVNLGGTVYTIKAKTIDEIDKWSAKVDELITKYSKEIGSYKYQNPLAPTKNEIFAAVLSIIIRKAPKDFIDLMFAYCPELPEAEIKKTVNVNDLMKAAKAVYRLSFPFFMELISAITETMPAGTLQKLI